PHGGAPRFRRPCSRRSEQIVPVARPVGGPADTPARRSQQASCRTLPTVWQSPAPQVNNTEPRFSAPTAYGTTEGRDRMGGVRNATVPSKPISVDGQFDTHRLISVPSDNPTYLYIAAHPSADEHAPAKSTPPGRGLPVIRPRVAADWFW